MLLLCDVTSTTGCGNYGEWRFVSWGSSGGTPSGTQGLCAYGLHLKTICLKLKTFSSRKKFSKTPIFLQKRGTGEFAQFRSNLLLWKVFIKFA
jgi:hypothetical protein